MSGQFSFHDRLASGLEQLGLVLDQAAVERLYRYFAHLQKWRKKINLIAKTSSDEEIVESHFVDSLSLLPLLEPLGCHLLDVGTGAGFPGLVLKCARPDMHLTLVEPRLKRVSFLKHIVRSLMLDQVTVLACRIEDEQQLPAERRFSHITSRAVTDIGTFLAMTGRFAYPGLQVICMKGPKWRQELAAAEEILAGLPFALSTTRSFTLPFSGAQRVLLVFEVVEKS